MEALREFLLIVIVIVIVILIGFSGWSCTGVDGILMDATGRSAANEAHTHRDKMKRILINSHLLTIKAYFHV